MELEMNHNYKLSHLWGVSFRLKPQVDMGAAAELQDSRQSERRQTHKAWGSTPRPAVRLRLALMAAACSTQ